MINLAASVLDHNSTLVCEAFNPLLPNQRVQDQMPINIHCRYCNYHQGFVSEMSCLDKPKISLSLGTSIEMNNIKEGEDIYLECLVDSRPEVSKLYYTHEVCRNQLNTTSSIKCRKS